MSCQYTRQYCLSKTICGLLRLCSRFAHRRPPFNSSASINASDKCSINLTFAQCPHTTNTPVCHLWDKTDRRTNQANDATQPIRWCRGNGMLSIALKTHKPKFDFGHPINNNCYFRVQLPDGHSDATVHIIGHFAIPIWALCSKYDERETKKRKETHKSMSLDYAMFRSICNTNNFSVANSIQLDRVSLWCQISFKIENCAYASLRSSRT